MRREREFAVKLRAQGKTYSEIQEELCVSIPKSTLSYWCRDVRLPKRSSERIARMSAKNLERGRKLALEAKIRARQEREIRFLKENSTLWEIYDSNVDVKKVALAMLFIAEGSKRTGNMVFGNSDVVIIKTFLSLLRNVYEIDEDKMRVTVQCRYDQNIKRLEKFWSKVTDVPMNKFYKAQVDPRTKDKITKKEGYMGVCRIDYFSAHVAHELRYIARMLESR